MAISNMDTLAPRFSQDLSQRHRQRESALQERLRIYNQAESRSLRAIREEFTTDPTTAYDIPTWADEIGRRGNGSDATFQALLEDRMRERIQREREAIHEALSRRSLEELGQQQSLMGMYNRIVGAATSGIEPERGRHAFSRTSGGISSQNLCKEIELPTSTIEKDLPFANGFEGYPFDIVRARKGDSLISNGGEVAFFVDIVGALPLGYAIYNQQKRAITIISNIAYWVNLDGRVVEDVYPSPSTPKLDSRIHLRMKYETPEEEML